MSQLLPFCVSAFPSSNVTFGIPNTFLPRIIWVLTCSLSIANEPTILGLIDRRIPYCKTTTPHRAILRKCTVGHKEDRSKKHGCTGPKTSHYEKSNSKSQTLLITGQSHHIFKKDLNSTRVAMVTINSLHGDFHFLFMLIFFIALLYSISPFISHIVIVNRVIDEVCSVKVMCIFYSCLL